MENKKKGRVWSAVYYYILFLILYAFIIITFPIGDMVWLTIKSHIEAVVMLFLDYYFGMK